MRREHTIGILFFGPPPADGGDMRHAVPLVVLLLLSCDRLHPGGLHPGRAGPDDREVGSGGGGAGGEGAGPPAAGGGGGAGAGGEPACTGDEARQGRDCLDGDGQARPARCCTWACTSPHVLCGAEPPSCPEGEVPAIVGGCWGPCVPWDRCEEAEHERRCLASGGTWELGCGHSSCGVAPSCILPRPSCTCGPLQIFDAARGCVESDVCHCVRTRGTWNENGCGHSVCGQVPTCKDRIPGCECRGEETFESGAGCRPDPGCG